MESRAKGGFQTLKSGPRYDSEVSSDDEKEKGKKKKLNYCIAVVCLLLFLSCVECREDFAECYDATVHLTSDLLVIKYHLCVVITIMYNVLSY